MKQTSKPSEGAFANVTTILTRQGYARFDARSLIGTGLVAAAEKLRQACRSELLALDPYDRVRCRRRFLDESLFVPWMDSIIRVPPFLNEDGEVFTMYQQYVTVNTVEKGVSRQFPGLSAAFASFPVTVVLSVLIRKLFRIFTQAGVLSFPMQPHRVGLHVIGLCPDETTPSVVSPDCFHHDDEPATAAILLWLENISGGQVWIGAPEAATAQKKPKEVPEMVKDTFTLQLPFQGYLVNDRVVSHYVSATERENKSETAARVVLLVDFTPVFAIRNSELAILTGQQHATH